MLLYPLIRDQKAAGSNPATSTKNPCIARVFFFASWQFVFAMNNIVNNTVNNRHITSAVSPPTS